MRVLLVDDEIELVSTIAERMQMRGIEADWACNGEDAIRLAEENRYDIAVLDLKMPKMGGLRLRKRLNEKHPGMKFIFLTGHGSEDDFKEASSESNVEYYLIKPVDITTLIEKMNAISG